MTDSPTGEEAAARSGAPKAKAPALPDLVVPVRQLPANERLRYALRSWAAHLPHRRVWLVGYRPVWTAGVGHIPTVQDTAGYSITAAVRAACEHPRVSDRFLLLDPDVFLMAPAEEVPVLHAGPVRDLDLGRYCGCSSGPTAQGVTETRDLLASLDHPNPLSYELAVPLPVDKAGILDAVNRAEGLPTVHVRTLYGNLAGIGGEQAEDVRINHRAPRDYQGQQFVSARPDAFNHGAVGRYVRDAFWVPCRYEEGGV